MLENIRRMFKKRMEICKENKCGHFIDLSLIKQCGECGCILNAKALIPSMRCGLGYWERESKEGKGNCSGCH